MVFVSISGITEVSEIAQRENRCLRSMAKMAENKMEAVAQLFGKKLGEEFTVKYQVSKYKWYIVDNLAFTDKGLTHYGKSKDVILRQLLTGQAVVVDE
jgi:hypothetical protein